MNNVKRYLMQIRLTDVRIQHLQRYVDELREMLTDTGGTDYTKPRVKSSISPDTMAERVVKIADIEKKIDREVDRLIDIRDRIVWQIGRLDDPDEITVLELRYVHMLKWEEIADKMGYSLRRVYQIHGAALINFNKHCI